MTKSIKKTKPKNNPEDVHAIGIGKRLKKSSSGEISKSEVSSSPPTIKPLAEPTAYDIFLKTIKRASNLVNVHKDGTKCDEQHYDSFRAAVVLSISALDAYVRTLVVDKILGKLSDKDKTLSNELKEYIKNLLNQEALLEAGRKYEFREKVEKAIRADFETKSFQGEYKINVYMELAGYKDIFEEVSHSANINKNRLRGDMEKFTKRRHVIAHCGDFDLNQIPHSENTIDKSYPTECIEVVKRFAEHLHKVTNK